MGKVKITKNSDTDLIKEYFESVIKLEVRGFNFPVELSEIWNLVYAHKHKAVEELKSNFIEDVDYHIFGKDTYMLTIDCMEKFIVSHVEFVYKIYNEVSKALKPVEASELEFIEDLIFKVNGKLMIDSLDVADMFGKNHRSVLITIGNLIIEDSATLSMFVMTTYSNEQNKTQPIFFMDRDGLSLLAIKFAEENLEDLSECIEVFNEVEKSIKQKTHSEALKKQQRKIKRQQKLLKEQEDKPLKKNKMNKPVW